MQNYKNSGNRIKDMLAFFIILIPVVIGILVNLLAYKVLKKNLLAFLVSIPGVSLNFIFFKPVLTLFAQGDSVGEVLGLVVVGTYMLFLAWGILYMGTIITLTVARAIISLIEKRHEESK